MKRLVLCTLFLFLFLSSYGQDELMPVYEREPVGNPPNTICAVRGYDTTTDLDWTATTFEYYQEGNEDNPFMLQSPFHSVQQNTNGNIYFLSATEEKDYLSAHGWRYVTHDFGDEGREIKNPYFVLYNYRSSILRVFIAVDELWDQNKQAMVTIEWLSSGRTALLEHFNGLNYVNTVDEFDASAVARVPNFFTNNVSPPYWLHADFAMNYDPCTCLYSSTMWIKANLIQESTLEFKIEGELLQEIDNNGRAGNAGTFAGNIDSSLKGFSAAYKDGASGFNTLKDKVFKTTTTNGQTTGGGIDNFVEMVNFISGGANVIGGVFRLINFFTGTSSAPSAATTPMVFRADLDVTGDMQTEVDYKEIPLETPGSDITVLESFLPHYDNVMGTFNVLTRPRVGVTAYSVPIGGGYSSLVFQYRLLEDIEYVVNPRTGINLDVEGTVIMASFEHNFYGAENMTASPAYHLNCFGDYVFQTSYVPAQPGASFDSDELYIKIIAVFKDLGGNSIPYIARYPVTIESVPGTGNTGYPPEAGYLGDDNCLGFYLPADNGRISEVCNDQKYKEQSGNLLPEDPATAFAEDAPSDPELENNKWNSNLTNSDDLILYPNPTPNHFVIRYGLAERGRIKLSLVNLQGQTLKVLLDEEDHYPGTYELGADLAEFSAGTYLLVRETDKGRTMGKIVVQK